MGRLTHRTRPGFTYFVTTKTWENRAIFQMPENANILIECMMRYREQGAYLLHEFVIMPNHLHFMLTPAATTTLEKAVGLIKGGSSREIHSRRASKIQIWQPGFHEESVRDATDFTNKVQYIRMNPVRSNLAENPGDWAYGSASGKFRMDAIPDRLINLASGAEAPAETAAPMSELKLRPPKNPSEGLKPRPPKARQA